MQVLLLLMLAIRVRVGVGGEGTVGRRCSHLDGLSVVGGHESALPSTIAIKDGTAGLLEVVMTRVAVFLIVVMAALTTGLGRGRLVSELLSLMLLGVWWWEQLGHWGGLLHRRVDYLDLLLLLRWRWHLLVDP